MPTTFPKCNAQFFAATSTRRVACDEGTSDSEDLNEADATGRNNTHVLSRTHREVYVCIYAYIRVCVHASATGSCDRITEKTTRRRKRGEGEARDLFARISTATADVAPEERISHSESFAKYVPAATNKKRSLLCAFDRCFSIIDFIPTALRAFNVCFKCNVKNEKHLTNIREFCEITCSRFKNISSTCDTSSCYTFMWPVLDIVRLISAPSWIATYPINLSDERSRRRRSVGWCIVLRCGFSNRRY